VIDRNGLAEFLRNRRESLQPEDVGMPRGQRRRTSGLRREEVAVLCHMSTDYYARIERGKGPLPSEQMIASIAQGLHLSFGERDHLFHLAGYPTPARGASSEFISPGLLRIFDRLGDTPAEIVTELGEVLRQTSVGIALSGDMAQYAGAERSIGFRWFTDPSTRQLYVAEDHEYLSRMFVSGLHEIVARRGNDSRAAAFVATLKTQSAEFVRLWSEHQIGLRPSAVKRFQHPQVGVLELHCQSLVDPDQSHLLLVYTAVPGSESYDKLQLLSVIGRQAITAET
jgi:transcriptional regulator with XRE-family HTH domain